MVFKFHVHSTCTHSYQEKKFQIKSKTVFRHGWDIRLKPKQCHFLRRVPHSVSTLQFLLTDFGNEGIKCCKRNCHHMCPKRRLPICFIYARFPFCTVLNLIHWTKKSLSVWRSLILIKWKSFFLYLQENED